MRHMPAIQQKSELKQVFIIPIMRELQRRGISYQLMTSHHITVNQLRMLFMAYGRVNFKYLLLLCSAKFYKRSYLKSGLLHDVFWSFMIFIVMIARGLFLFHCIKLLVTCCASSTTVCLVMPNIVSLCIYLYLSVRV